MKKRTIMTIAVLGLLVILTVPSIAAWSINPAKWTLYARTSTDYEITPKVWPLEIKNTGDTPITVDLSIKQPDYTYDGNTPMENLSWVSISETHLVVEGNSTKQVKLTIDVKNATENYNQSMEFWIFADQTAGAGNIQTDYNCRWTYQSPIRYVPMDQRPGYIPWGLIIPIIGVLAGISAVAFILARRGMFRHKKPTKKPTSMREMRRNEAEVRKADRPVPVANNNPISQEPAPVGNGNNIVKYKKKG